MGRGRSSIPSGISTQIEEVRLSHSPNHHLHNYMINCFLVLGFRHLGENKAQLVLLKKTGHAINEERPKEMYKHMKSFLCTDAMIRPNDNAKRLMLTSLISPVKINK